MGKDRSSVLVGLKPTADVFRLIQVLCHDLGRQFIKIVEHNKCKQKPKQRTTFEQIAIANSKNKKHALIIKWQIPLDMIVMGDINLQECATLFYNRLLLLILFVTYDCY